MTVEWGVQSVCECGGHASRGVISLGEGELAERSARGVVAGTAVAGHPGVVVHREIGEWRRDEEDMTARVRAAIAAMGGVRVDENGCFTLNDGSCVSAGPCIHTPRHTPEPPEM